MILFNYFKIKSNKKNRLKNFDYLSRILAMIRMVPDSETLTLTAFLKLVVPLQGVRKAFFILWKI